MSQNPENNEFYQGLLANQTSLNETPSTSESLQQHPIQQNHPIPFSNHLLSNTTANNPMIYSLNSNNINQSLPELDNIQNVLNSASSTSTHGHLLNQPTQQFKKLTQEWQGSYPLSNNNNQSSGKI